MESKERTDHLRTIQKKRPGTFATIQRLPSVLNGSITRATRKIKIHEGLCQAIQLKKKIIL